jgi:CRP/FNR family transcriptional regulator
MHAPIASARVRAATARSRFRCAGPTSPERRRPFTLTREGAGDAGLLTAAAINRAIHFFREACAIALSSEALTIIDAIEFETPTGRLSFVMHQCNFPLLPKSGCPTCVMRGLGICDVLIELELDRTAPVGPAVAQRRTDFAARRPISNRNEPIDGVPIICEGWAVNIFRLSKGRRQILSFLLPGEMIAGRLLFEPQLQISVEAVTNGSYRIFARAQLQSAMFASKEIFDRLLSAYNDERRRADQLIADLGRRTASERIARLLLDIWSRLEKAGKTEDGSVEFPLRQTHIADATGLTTVYVSKVINAFRHDGLVEVTDRSLKILNIEKLRQLTA